MRRPETRNTRNTRNTQKKAFFDPETRNTAATPGLAEAGNTQHAQHMVTGDAETRNTRNTETTLGAEAEAPSTSPFGCTSVYELYGTLETAVGRDRARALVNYPAWLEFFFQGGMRFDQFGESADQSR